MNESEESWSRKLSLVSPSSMWEEGCTTPPIIAPLSIPFKWEEVPGKPKPRNDIPCGLSTSKSLHLPPRLLLHHHGSPPPTNSFALRSRSCRKMESPTSILNSPPTSTASSTSSHDIDDLPRLHKMTRLLDHWTSTLRWPKSQPPQRNKWLLTKMKRTSRVFRTILKRMRSRKEDSLK